MTKESKPARRARGMEPRTADLNAFVGAELRRLRKEANLTLQDVAKLLEGFVGLKCASDISTRERGWDEWTVTQVHACATLYGASPAAVLTVAWMAFKAAVEVGG